MVYGPNCGCQCVINYKIVSGSLFNQTYVFYGPHEKDKIIFDVIIGHLAKLLQNR